MLFHPKNKYSIHFLHESLSLKFSYAKREYGLCLKKRKKKSMPKGVREKNACQRA
jgi:hypothetical protein